MAETEKQITMTAQLYDMREKARRLLGADYTMRMAQIGKSIKEIAERDNNGVLAAAIGIAKTRHLTGLDVILVMSAAVELVEPSIDKQEIANDAPKTCKEQKSWI